MIIRIPPRDKATSSYVNLATYMVNAQGNEAVLYTATADYIMDTQNDGEKVAWYAMTNTDSDIPAFAIAQIEATQHKNTRSKADKTLHIIVSLADGEYLNKAQWKEVEQAVADILDLQEHQRISAVHQNTDCWHMHIAINKVHPQKLTVNDPSYSHNKLRTLSLCLEQKYDLQKTVWRKEHGFYAGSNKSQANETLKQWAGRVAGESLQDFIKIGKSWDDLHAMLSDYGLVIKPYANGLVIGTEDGKYHVPASHIHRSLSKMNLEKQLGAYEHKQTKTQERTHSERMNYSQSRQSKERRENDASKKYGSHPLFQQYRRQESENKSLYASEWAAIKQEEQQRRNRLYAWAKEARGELKQNHGFTGNGKKMAYQTVHTSLKQHLNELKYEMTERKQALKSQHVRQSWDDFLMTQSRSGNEEALRLLRQRLAQRERLKTSVLESETMDEAKDIILKGVKPKFMRNGDVYYYLKDTGLVVDQKASIHVAEVTEASVVMALELAEKRFSKRVVVHGDDAFKKQVAQRAGQLGVQVRFADATLEYCRQHANHSDRRR
jgi:hypothetical protein